MIMPGQCFSIPSFSAANFSGSEDGDSSSLRTWACTIEAPASNAACVLSICSATPIGTAELLAFVGSEPVITTLMMPDLLIAESSDIEEDGLALTLQAPHAGPVRGLGVPEGLTLIVGGGYHGKSTLLHALQRGVYDHIPGDGRERAARSVCRIFSGGSLCSGNLLNNTAEDGTPFVLGNSVIEGVVGNGTVAASSCITCHFYASFTEDGSVAPAATAILPYNPTGRPLEAPLLGSLKFDFMWGVVKAP